MQKEKFLLMECLGYVALVECRLKTERALCFRYSSNPSLTLHYVGYGGDKIMKGAAAPSINSLMKMLLN